MKTNHMKLRKLEANLMKCSTLFWGRKITGIVHSMLRNKICGRGLKRTEIINILNILLTGTIYRKCTGYHGNILLFG